MSVEDSGLENVYCGYRIPWKYYSTGSTVSITFIKSPYYYGWFKMFFQEGKKVLHKAHIFSAQLHEQKYPLNEIKHEERQFLYLVTNHSQTIEVNIAICWSGIHAAVYDGPGVKSPQKQVRANVTSSAFIMLIVILVGERLTPVTGCQSYLDLQYKSIHNDMEKCQESVQENAMQIFLRNELFGTGRCTWTIPVRPSMLMINDDTPFSRPETLLDEEHCIYGGIYIYSGRHGTELEEVLSICRSHTDLEPHTFIPDKDATTVIVAVKFDPYSVIDQPFILIYDWNKTLYNRRIDLCNTENICETNFDFPVDPCGYQYDMDIHAQYIGKADVSIRVHFSENRAPKYDAHITSSLCETPPHYCACVKMHVQYANSVSYFISEARHTERIVSMNKGQTDVNVSVASSLYINTSACEETKSKVWWDIRFSPWNKMYATDHWVIYIENVNSIFPFMPNEKCSLYFLPFDNILTVRRPSPWWYIVHVIPQNYQETETHYATKVCIECLTCHNIEVHVEVLQPGRNESIVYTVSNNAPLDTTHMCRTGILCNTCNIILIYKGNLPPDQRGRCSSMCYSTLSIKVEKVARRKKQSTFVTSIKQTQTSKISNR